MTNKTVNNNSLISISWVEFSENKALRVPLNSRAMLGQTSKDWQFPSARTQSLYDFLNFLHKIFFVDNHFTASRRLVNRSQQTVNWLKQTVNRSKNDCQPNIVCCAQFTVCCNRLERPQFAVKWSATNLYLSTCISFACGLGVVFFKS